MSIIPFLVSYVWAQSDGVNGERGNAGVFGQDGRPGNVIVATGCESFLRKSIEGLKDAFGTEDWKEDREWMCANKNSLTENEAKYLHSVLDQKIKNLIDSKLFQNMALTEGSLEQTSFESVERKIQFLGHLFERAEKLPIVDFGCRKGFYLDKYQRRFDLNVCQTMKPVLGHQGQLEYQVEVTANTFECEDRKVSNVYQQNFTLKSSPEICHSGAPKFVIQKQGTYVTGEQWTGFIEVNCSQIKEQYSAIYPTVLITIE